MSDNVSLADIAAVTNNEDGFGGGAWWIILLFLCLFGGGWNRGGNMSEAVTESSLCNSMNFNNLEGAVGRLNDQMDSQNMMLSQGMSTLGYNEAQMNAQTNANITASTQKILDKMNENEIQALRDRIGQLELAAATANVVRFPEATTYQAGPNPFFAPQACACTTAF